MAFASLGLASNSTDPALGASEYLQERLSRTKEVALTNFNVFPGVEYYFDGLKLMWTISDEDRFKETYRALGLDDQTIRLKVELIKQNQVALNFETLHNLFLYYKRSFDSIFDDSLVSYQTPISVTFDTLFDAGATPLMDGSNAITISSGVFNFERWFYLRQMFDELLPIFQRSESDRQIVLTPEQQYILLRTTESLHVLSRIMLQDTTRDRTRVSAASPKDAAPALQFLTYFQQMLQNPKFRLTRDQRRSEWRSAAAFILCHELGHINLGHVNEIREWLKNPAHSEAEKEERLLRRRKMEHEADSYGIAHMTILMSHILQKNYKSIAEADLDPSRDRDYILPVIDLFTIMDMGQRGVIDFAAPDIPYPSNLQRLHYLLSGKGTHSSPMVEHYMSQMTVLSDHFVPEF